MWLNTDMEITTDHERRARRAKAVALATVLADAGTAVDDVAHLTAAAWRVAAQAATQRRLLGTTPSGKPRTVHPPHSEATVLTVMTELAHLLELRAAQGREADAAAAQILRSAGYDSAADCLTAGRSTSHRGEVCDHCGTLTAGAFAGLTPAEVDAMSNAQRAEHEQIEAEREADAEPAVSGPVEDVAGWRQVSAAVAHGMGIRSPWVDAINARKPGEYSRPEFAHPATRPLRRATDSAGYRETVRQLDPETAQTFAMFSGTDRR
jgi:hypothetical protein